MTMRWQKNCATDGGRWIGLHDLMALEPVFSNDREVPLDRTAWVALWRPYWLDKRRIPSWLPLAPSRVVLGRLSYRRE
ncbi:hypothetical protein SAMN05444161_1881 [Rhizobiales bacterium GAS191]|nr:hypothetical protein SAMN05444161_1881 [Rhizobiales bacterium GAS191]